MIDLTGQTALITGASGAIGSGISKLLHKLGAFVVISGSNEEKLVNLGNILKNNYKIKVCDLADKNSCSQLISGLDKIDILVCNAGITNDTLAIKMSDEVFSQVLNINLLASFTLNREAIKKMMRERHGRIVNIASIVAVTGNPGQSNYCASKAGLIGMTKSLAAEVATRGITINAIAPGFIESDMTNKLNDVQKDTIMQRIPTKTLGSPLDIAHAVAFLASKEAHYITGQTLHVNGGLLMV
jgi:3-oxoacyl-[acyl-carrier protein] reductase